MVGMDSEQSRPDHEQQHTDSNVILRNQADYGESGGGPAAVMSAVQPWNTGSPEPSLPGAQEMNQTDDVPVRVPQGSTDTDMLDFTCFGPAQERVEEAQNAVRKDSPFDAGKTSAMASPGRSRKTRTAKKLDKAFTRMNGLRDQVFSQREGLRMEYDDLSYRLDQVRQSQMELMDALQIKVNNVSPGQDAELVNILWQQARRDDSTFNARLERVQQISHHLIEPEAHLIIADEDFVAAAKKTNTLLQAAALSERPPAEAKQSEETITVPRTTESGDTSLLERLQERRADIQMYKERLNELFREQHEDLDDRAFLRERDDVPKISDEEFFGSFYDAQTAINADLEQAFRDVEELESACLQQGLDPSEDIPDIESSAASQAVEEDETAERQSEQHSLPSVTGQTTPKNTESEAQAWSATSVAGSSKTASTDDAPSGRIYDWIQPATDWNEQMDEPLEQMDEPLEQMDEPPEQRHGLLEQRVDSLLQVDHPREPMDDSLEQTVQWNEPPTEEVNNAFGWSEKPNSRKPSLDRRHSSAESQRSLRGGPAEYQYRNSWRIKRPSSWSSLGGMQELRDDRSSGERWSAQRNRLDLSLPFGGLSTTLY